MPPHLLYIEPLPFSQTPVYAEWYKKYFAAHDYGLEEHSAR